MFSPLAVSPLTTAAVAAGTLGPGTPPVAFFSRGSGEGTSEDAPPLGSTGNVDDPERLLLLEKPTVTCRLFVRRSGPRNGSWKPTSGGQGRCLRRRRCGWIAVAACTLHAG